MQVAGLLGEGGTNNSIKNGHHRHHRHGVVFFTGLQQVSFHPTIREAKMDTHIIVPFFEENSTNTCRDSCHLLCGCVFARDAPHTTSVTIADKLMTQPTASHKLHNIPKAGSMIQKTTLEAHNHRTPLETERTRFSVFKCTLP